MVKIKVGDRVQVNRFKWKPRGWSDLMMDLMDQQVEVVDANPITGDIVIRDHIRNSTWCLLYGEWSLVDGPVEPIINVLL